MSIEHWERRNSSEHWISSRDHVMASNASLLSRQSCYHSVHQVSILSTSYEQLFHMKRYANNFFELKFLVLLFPATENWQKTACKMLVKLTTGVLVIIWSLTSTELRSSVFAHLELTVGWMIFTLTSEWLKLEQIFWILWTLLTVTCQQRKWPRQESRYS